MGIVFGIQRNEYRFTVCNTTLIFTPIIYHLKYFPNDFHFITMTSNWVKNLDLFKLHFTSNEVTVISSRILIIPRHKNFVIKYLNLNFIFFMNNLIVQVTNELANEVENFSMHTA